MEILYAPFALLIAIPGAGLVPAAILLFAFWRRRSKISPFNRRVALFACLAWLVYGLYETTMYFWLQSVTAPIRVDLLLIVPILYGVTIWAIIALCTGRTS